MPFQGSGYGAKRATNQAKEFNASKGVMEHKRSSLFAQCSLVAPWEQPGSPRKGIQLARKETGTRIPQPDHYLQEHTFKCDTGECRILMSYQCSTCVWCQLYWCPELLCYLLDAQSMRRIQAVGTLSAVATSVEGDSALPLSSERPILVRQGLPTSLLNTKSIKL